MKGNKERDGQGKGKVLIEAREKRTERGGRKQCKTTREGQRSIERSGQCRGGRGCRDERLSADLFLN